MTTGAWIVVAVLAYLALGQFALAGFRPTRAPRAAPQLERVRDQQLDITEAIERGRR